MTLCIARLAIALAGVMALLGARRSPGQGALGAAMLLALAGDVARALLPMPRGAALVLCLLPLATGAWAALVVLGGDLDLPRLGRVSGPVTASAALVSLVMTVSPMHAWPRAAFLLLAGLEVLLLARWLRRRGRGSLPEKTAALLATGDLFALAGPAGPLPVWPRSWFWLAAAQAGVVALGVAALQIRAWLEDARRERGDRRPRGPYRDPSPGRSQDRRGYPSSSPGNSGIDRVVSRYWRTRRGS